MISEISRLLKRAKQFQLATSNRKKSLTLNSLTVLFILEEIRINEYSEPNVTEMARLLNCSVSSASNILRRMEAQKLIRRRVARTNQRGRQSVVSSIRVQGSKYIEWILL